MQSRPFLISFSGMDGAGKSTQIENLRRALEARGLRTGLLAFWDDVVVLARYREGFVHKVFKSERGIGAPGKPVNRRDKNVRGWYVSLARHGMYFMDALNLRRVLAGARGAEVIIMDRYIHDELANLPLANPLTRAFVRFVAAIAPRPDVAYVLDADPEAARERKPEYPLEYLHICRHSYHRLATMLGLTVVPPLPITEASRAVEQAFVRAWIQKFGAGKNLAAKDGHLGEGIADSELPVAG
ncbi:MAG: dTMP kinase [Terriglobales bacterium]